MFFEEILEILICFLGTLGRKTKKGLQEKTCNPLIIMARRGRFELPTF